MDNRLLRPDRGQLQGRNNLLRSFEVRHSQDYLFQWVVPSSFGQTAGDWVELPLSLLQSFYAACLPAPMASAATAARSVFEPDQQSQPRVGEGWRCWTIAHKTCRHCDGVLAHVQVWCRCFRRESAALLWHTALLPDVLRPVRIGAAGAEIRWLYGTHRGIASL